MHTTPAAVSTRPWAPVCWRDCPCSTAPWDGCGLCTPVKVTPPAPWEDPLHLSAWLFGAVLAAGILLCSYP